MNKKFVYQVGNNKKFWKNVWIVSPGSVMPGSKWGRLQNKVRYLAALYLLILVYDVYDLWRTSLTHIFLNNLQARFPVYYPSETLSSVPPE